MIFFINGNGKPLFAHLLFGKPDNQVVYTVVQLGDNEITDRSRAENLASHARIKGLVILCLDKYIPVILCERRD